jgi:hypothetical protein
MRQVIRQSSQVRHYEPGHAAAWQEAAARFSAEPIRTPEQQ